MASGSLSNGWRSRQHFPRTGEVYVQSLNLQTFAGSLSKYAQEAHNK